MRLPAPDLNGSLVLALSLSRVITVMVISNLNNKSSVSSPDTTNIH